MLMKELREMGTKELNDELIASQRELLGLRVQKSSGEIANPHSFKKVKKQIARIKTLLSQKLSK